MVKVYTSIQQLLGRRCKPTIIEVLFRFHTTSLQLLIQKRTPTINDRQNEVYQFRLRTIIRKTLNQKRTPTISEWHELREKLLLIGQHEKAIDKLILDNCSPDQLHTVKSYINYLMKECKQKLCKGTWISMLELYCNASKCGGITAEHQQDIIDIYQYLCGTHSFFDAKLSSAIVQGLALTADWRKSLDILGLIRNTNQTVPCYSAIVRRAIQEDDEFVLWNLYDKIIAQRSCLRNELFTMYINHCERNASKFRENIDKMLASIRDNRIMVSAEVANELHRAFRIRFNYSCNITTVSKLGKCYSCGKHLRSAELTDDEFNDLKSHFWSNICNKATPKEIEAFQPFIDGSKTYDIVIDGLNTNKKSSRRIPGETECMSAIETKSYRLADVVKYFVDRKQAVLVVGRQHMKEWTESQMCYISENADLFLTENTSEDDEFFIYSALKSGPNTNFVTRDKLKNHALRLDGQLRTIFLRWQQQHQHIIQLSGDPNIVTFEDRIEFDMTAQQVDDGCWHIPFEDGSQCTSQGKFMKLWKNWLCVSKK